jgi:hypothetical protein
MGVIPQNGSKRYAALRVRVPLDLLIVDEELQDISMLILEAGEFVAEANELRDGAKDYLTQVESEVADALRHTSNDEKAPSETKIASLIPLNAKYQEAQLIYNRTKLDATLWANLQDTLRTKSHSIRAAADLVQAGFLSQDVIYRKRREETQAIRDERAANRRPEIR